MFATFGVVAENLSFIMYNIIINGQLIIIWNVSSFWISGWVARIWVICYQFKDKDGLSPFPALPAVAAKLVLFNVIAHK